MLMPTRPKSKPRLRTDLAVIGAAHHVGLSAHQPLSETTHHLTQQIVVVGLELPTKPHQYVPALVEHRVPFTVANTTSVDATGC